MFKLKVLCLCVYLAAGAPSKERTYGHSIVGDTFRPKFPGVDIQKETSDGGELLLFKMSDPLFSIPDTQPALNTPTGTKVDLDAINVRQKGEHISPKKSIFHAEDRNTHIQVPEGSGVTRDIIEKPIVEKTIIKECNCEKHIEEKHLDETFELASDENTPEESQYQGSVIPASSNPEDNNSKKDLYDEPINPDFGLSPSDSPEDINSKKDLYDVPVNPDFGLPTFGDPENNNSKMDKYDVPINPDFGLAPSDDSVNMSPEKGDDPSNVESTDLDQGTIKKHSYETEISEQERPDYKPNFPEVPETDISLIPEQSVPRSELPGEPEQPGQTDEVPMTTKHTTDAESDKSLNDKEEPILPAQGDETVKTISMTNEPEGTSHNFDTQYPKAPVSLPDDRKEQETESYPLHPVDGPKIPIEAVPFGPKTEAPFIESKVPDDSHQIPTGIDVDIKPDIIEPADTLTQKPTEIDHGKTPNEFPVASTGSPSHGNKPLPSTPTISAVCEDMGLRKFIHLLNKAGYKDMLTRKRPLTIFVPSDEAWNHLPLYVLNRLQRDQRFLRRVLRYHMVDGLESGQIRRDYYCPSMQQGAGFFLNTYGKNMYVNGVQALPSPVKPANGAVYVLSRVMYPLPANNLAEAIQTTGTFTRFYTLAAEAGILDRELSERGPYTLFAPTDEAFSKLPHKTIEWLTWDKEALRELLLKHLVSGTYYSTFVPDNEEGHLTSLNGGDIEFKHSDEKGEFSVNGAHLCDHDLTAKNGVLHAVDEVLFANELKPRPFVRPPLKSIYG